jgi:hypothetical protein
MVTASALFVGCGGAQKQRPVQSSEPLGDTQPARTTTTATPTAPVDLRARGAAAATVVREFYAAVDAKRFSDAWPRLSSAIQQKLGGLDTWQAGYTHTRSTKVDSAVGTATDATHATVDVRLHSRDVDSCGRSVTQRFAGTWTLRRFSGRWQASNLAIDKTGGGTLRSASQCTSPTPPSTGAQAPRSSSSSSRAGSESAGSGTGEGSDGRVCYPSLKLPAVHLPAVHLPAVHLPAVTVGGERIPAQTIPAQTIPAQTIPAQTLPGGCFDAPKSFAIGNTTVRTSNYAALDPGYSPALSTKYWDSTPDVSVPDPTAAGFGELNAAGFPKNQYLRPYVRRDGTFVHGYWRNSPSDGLPTCRVISC